MMEGQGCVVALSELGPDRLHLVQHHLHRHHSRARFRQLEFGGLFDQVDGVLSGGGKRDHGCLTLLRLKQVRAEIRVVERRPHPADHLAA